LKTITILVPAYNEEDTLHYLYDRVFSVVSNIEDYAFELLFVNDGSQDETINIIKELRDSDKRVSFVELSRNFGKETAMIAGLDHAKGDAVIILDADLQDPPELITEMIYYWELGYDDVYARRRSREGETWAKKATASMFYKVLQKFSNVPIQENTGDFRLLDRRCVEAMKQLRETQRYTKGMFSWVGYHKKEILFDRDPRISGETKWNYAKLMDLAIEGLTSFTTAPLRLSSFLGIGVSFFAFIYMAFIIIKTLVFGEPVAGYPSLMSAILFIGGIQLTVLGIIGEYLARVFNETKKRPLYFVDEYNNQKASNLYRDRKPQYEAVVSSEKDEQSNEVK